MDQHRVDTIASNVSAVSRRITLLTLGAVTAAGVASVQGPSWAEIGAQKKRRKARKAHRKCQKQTRTALEEQLRSRHEDELRICRQAAADICTTFSNPARCEEDIDACCAPLATGQFYDAVHCLLGVLSL